MVWKHDLAKLKQQLNLKPEAGPPPKTPKAVPKEAPPIQDEDALFLSAMGVKATKPKAGPGATAPPKAETPTAAPEAEFSSLMADLKGLKPMPKGLAQAPAEAPVKARPEPVQARPEPTSPAPSEVASEAPEVLSQPPVEAAVPVGAPVPGPRLIHLAAGMAVDVDGTLDLRGHSLPDARERLKERMHDAQAMGWRTLLVTLGESQPLHEEVMELLRTSPHAAALRYAQAPIPMGGGNAWILYFG